MAAHHTSWLSKVWRYLSWYRLSCSRRSIMVESFTWREQWLYTFLFFEIKL